MEWIGPPSSTSRSMSTTLPPPGRVWQVMRVGRPKAKPPISMTLSPLIWPTRVALGGDQRDALEDRLLRAVAQSRGATHARLQRALDVGARHDVALGLARAEVRFDQRLAQVVDPQRQLARMGGEPRGVLDDARGRLRVERPEAVAARQRTHQPSEDRLVLRGARQVVLEIGENLEELAEVRVPGGEQEIEQAVAEQHDFHPQRNGVGLERNRAGQAEKAADVLDDDLAAPQRAFERASS